MMELPRPGKALSIVQDPMIDRRPRANPSHTSHIRLLIATLSQVLNPSETCHPARSTASQKSLLICGANVDLSAIRPPDLCQRSMEVSVEAQHHHGSEKEPNDEGLPPSQVSVAPPRIMCGLFHGRSAI